MSLLFIALVNFQSSAFLFQYDPMGKKTCSEQAKVVVSKGKSLRSRVGQRQKIIGQCGSWYILRVTENLLCLACVGEGYPERTVYALMEKLHAIMRQKPPAEDQSEKKVKGLSKEMLALCEKYRDASVDKVRLAQREADLLRQELNQGVKKLIGNQDNLEEINHKASLMKDYAKTFEKNAGQLEKNLCWRKYKFFLIIGVIIVIAFVGAGLIIYLKTHQ